MNELGIVCIRRPMPLVGSSHTLLSHVAGSVGLTNRDLNTRASHGQLCRLTASLGQRMSVILRWECDANNRNFLTSLASRHYSSGRRRCNVSCRRTSHARTHMPWRNPWRHRSAAMTSLTVSAQQQWGLIYTHTTRVHGPCSREPVLSQAFCE